MQHIGNLLSVPAVLCRLRRGDVQRGQQTVDIASLLEEGLVRWVITKQVQQQSEAVLHHYPTVCPAFKLHDLHQLVECVLKGHNLLDV